MQKKKIKDYKNKEIEKNIKDKKQEKKIKKFKKIEEKISSLIKKKKKKKLKYYADINNIKKNNKKKIDLIKNNQIKNFLKSIVPIIDKIDKLIKISQNSNLTQNTIIEGIQLTKNIFEKNLKIWRIKKIDQVNIAFNHNIHTLQDKNINNNLSNNSTIKNIKKNGYIFKNKIIKKAIVTI
ncbi:nucleotide exchange factor GrpE [Buchnera aphidicola]|uniref:Protein GrpE n=1 Tax=Buchnera aphidicola (Cinara curvipes) TaxID=2518975 RepID=A0A451D6F4_9GAMM|nr:nucleotide exchange factor GrpE [Buchnera aphidicola]VFP81420.1 Protein GrpE [Buchnera aphidicola (Cinara curvipes)]